MQRFILICLLGLCVGCEGTGVERGDREARPRRERRHKPDTPIVEPKGLVVGKFTDMQKAQIASRVTMFHDIAGHIRDGNIKTMFELNKAITESQIAAGTNVNKAMSERFASELQQGDNLQSDAADKCDKYAAELETLIK